MEGKFGKKNHLGAWAGCASDLCFSLVHNVGRKPVTFQRYLLVENEYVLIIKHYPDADHFLSDLDFAALRLDQFSYTG